MQKCLLAATIFFKILSCELYAQQVPAVRAISDSLMRVMPHESQVEKAMMYLKVADLIEPNLPQTAFSYSIMAFRISIAENNDSLKAMARLQMGDYYNDRHLYMKAQEQYLASCNSYHAISDTTGELNALLRIGIINRTLKNYEKALNYLQKGMTILQGVNTMPLKGLLLEQIAYTYQHMGDHEAAVSFFSQAYSMFQQAGDKKNELRMQNNIGGVFLDKNRDDEALKLFNRLLIESDSSDYELRGILYTRIGHIYYKKNDHRTSLNYNLKALKIRQRRQAPAEINSSLINVAGDYYNLGKQDSGKFYMDSGLLMAARSDRKYLLENGYRHLYNYYRNVEDYKEALRFYAQYSYIREEINRERNRNKIEILEINQHLQRIQQYGKLIAKKRDIQSLNLKYHNLQSVILEVLLGMAGISMIVFVFLLFYVRRLRRKMQDLNVQLSDEIREREITEMQTREHENQYKFLTDNTVDFITHLDSQKKRTYASSASLNFYGYGPEEILSKSLFDLSHPDYHQLIEDKFADMIETRSSKQFVYKARKKDGTAFWVESVWNPLFDPISGIFKGMVVVTRDIHERKTKEFEIMEGTMHTENLLKEIHHRVKNNFAILVSLINMQMGQTKNQELLHSLTNLQLRIRTMSLVHEMLYRSGDFEKISFPGYLRSLVSVIAGAYNRHDVELAIEADERVMDIETSIPLGLIINEILSNSYKHAFPNGRSGKILIRYKYDHETGINTLALRDDGIGMPEGIKPDQHKTMGLQVVHILCSQIEATLVVANEQGATFTITFRFPER